jgi:F-box interacting protein
MAEAAGAAASPTPHRGLPEEIVVWEILVRLPPKSLLRCHAVCSAWRRATSARDFLLAHHARQPALRILDGGESILVFDNRSAAAQLQPVARLGEVFYLDASCDGLLILYSKIGNDFSICNPATRQCAPLPQLSGFKVLGMYPHSPTGEYRILATDFHEACYIFALDSAHPPRSIGSLPPEAEGIIHWDGVLVRGRLHWALEDSMVMVFNTTAESFHLMRSPSTDSLAFEMDGMLGMYNFTYATKIVNIWVLQDYESEVWTFKCRIQLPLPVTDFSVRSGYATSCSVCVMRGNGEFLMLVKFAECLLQVDMDGKLVATFRRQDVWPTPFQLKQTLVPHAFFPTLEGYVVNDVPFI